MMRGREVIDFLGGVARDMNSSRADRRADARRALYTAAAIGWSPEFAAKIVPHATEIMQRRGAHYAEGEDRWKNFRAACRINGVDDGAENMAYYAAMFAMKHIAYILTVSEGQDATEEKLLESFADVYNYCLICDAILKGNK